MRRSFGRLKSGDLILPPSYSVLSGYLSLHACIHIYNIYIKPTEDNSFLSENSVIGQRLYNLW